MVSATFTLTFLAPLVLTTNALFFEPPSAQVARRHLPVRRRFTQHPPMRRQTSGGAQWSSVGCYTDDVGERTFQAKRIESDQMTAAYCQAFCDHLGYQYAGTEWGRECFCDNDFYNTGAPAPGGDCNMMCTGDSTESCGGPVRLSVYKNSGTVGDSDSPVSTEAIVMPNYGDWSSQGCYVDSVSARIVPNQVYVAQPVGPQKCLETCASLGYAFAGLEYMHECFCANDIDVAQLTSTDVGECNSTCDGDPRFFCGAGNRLLLYRNSGYIAPPDFGSVSGWTGQGCFTDYLENRVLPDRYYVPGGMTIDKCIEACSNNGYSYAGVEFANECCRFRVA
ncbi:hypothetical protein FRC14_000318 [Serendipita sp. 396]|nr:hypothetical protein FRC14_000318 [Serendipita sp. 396]